MVTSERRLRSPGYGQTETLDGNIANLKSLGDYARKNGVEIGLWTQSDLHPKEGVSALLQRDIVKEVRDAGVRVLKTDVAWVGAGYSFGLNGVADVGHIMPYYGNDGRPFIISLDGWAGTQRYAGIWSGDQTRRRMGIYPFSYPYLYRFRSVPASRISARIWTESLVERMRQSIYVISNGKHLPPCS